MDRLLDLLCDHRAYGPLRVLLPHYPMPNGFSDEGAELANALKTVSTHHRSNFSADEMELVISLQQAVESGLAGGFT